jgi:hypothetical protein
LLKNPRKQQLIGYIQMLFVGEIEMDMVELLTIMMQETFDSRFEQAQYDEAEIQDQSYSEKISADDI